VNDVVDARLDDLRARTESLGPRAGFQARVVGVLAARSKAVLFGELVRSARLLVPVALVIATLSVGFAAGEGDVTSADLAVAERSWELAF
jgi:hypothetical protein